MDIDWSRNLRDFPHLKCAQFLFIITFLRRIRNSFVIIHRINYQTVLFISVQLSYYYVIAKYQRRHHTHSLFLMNTIWGKHNILMRPWHYFVNLILQKKEQVLLHFHHQTKKSPRWVMVHNLWTNTGLYWNASFIMR